MASTRQWLSDETWAAVDPRSARLSRGQRRTVVLLAVLAVFAALVPVLSSISGLTDPRLALWPREVTIHRSTTSFTVQWRVENADWFAETVTGLTLKDQEGVSVARLSPSRLTVPAHGSRIVTVDFHVDDCTAPSGSDMLVQLRLARPWGAQTVEIAAEEVTDLVTRYEQDVFMSGAAAMACGR